MVACDSVYPFHVRVRFVCLLEMLKLFGDAVLAFGLVVVLSTLSPNSNNPL